MEKATAVSFAELSFSLRKLLLLNKAAINDIYMSLESYFYLALHFTFSAANDMEIAVLSVVDGEVGWGGWEVYMLTFSVSVFLTNLYLVAIHGKINFRFFFFGKVWQIKMELNGISD